MILDEIVKNKRKELASKDRGKDISSFLTLTHLAGPPKDFAKAISKPVSLIAEVKKASPSAGVIKEDYDPVLAAKEYEKAGASAVSVLTDAKYFKGSILDLGKVEKEISLPVLRKDFIIDDYQIYEARAFGADAVLLIAAVLSDGELGRLIKLTYDIDMDAMVEVHTKEELKRVLEVVCAPGPCQLKPLIIGINNRDLKTMNVDLQTTVDLMKIVPKDKDIITVSESGIKTKEDIKRAKESGVNAVLVGESLMSSGNITSKIKELLS